MNKVTLCIGSNTGDRQGNIHSAIIHLSKIIGRIETSGIYETVSEDGKGGPYMNTVLSGETGLTLDGLIKYAKRWEVLNGRTLRSKQLGEITIDIDIIIWNGDIVRRKEYDSRHFSIGYRQLRMATKDPQEVY